MSALAGESDAASAVGAPPRMKLGRGGDGRAGVWESVVLHRKMLDAVLDAMMDNRRYKGCGGFCCLARTAGMVATFSGEG